MRELSLFHGLETTVPRVGSFLVLWLLVGFALGSSLLMGPVRWLTAALRGRGAPQWMENASVLVVIALLVWVSASVARWGIATAVSSPARHVPWGIAGLALLLAASALVLWLQPEVMGARAKSLEGDDGRFTFGPFPQETDLRRLRAAGYTAVVSLLHPAVAPFEPALLEREREAAQRVGIELIHVPMLPWVSRNRDALAELEALAATGSGRYYVHCYLGQDRVSLARGALGGGSASEFATRKVRELLPGFPLERGKIVELGDDVYLTGMPTDEEFVYYVANAGVDHVVSLLDPGNPENLPWIERERDALESLGIPLVEMPLSNPRPDPEAVAAAVATVRSLDGRVLVHDFLAPSTGRARAAEEFAAAFRKERTPALVRFARRARPDLRTVVLMAPLLLLVVAVPAGWVGRLRVDGGMSVASTRKIFHFSVFTLAAAVQMTAGLQATVLFAALFAAVVGYAVLRGEGFPLFEALASPKDQPGRQRSIVVPALAALSGGVLANLFFGRLAYLGYLVAGWGGAVAENGATSDGPLPASAAKTWGDSVVVLICGALAAMLGLGADGYLWKTTLGVGLAAGACGAVAEAVTRREIDNLTVQLAATGSAFALIVLF